MTKVPSKRSEYKKLVVWHADQSPPNKNNASVYCWNGYIECLEYNSIPVYLEANAERLRAKYLSFIYELGETEIDGKSIVEHLEVGKGYNLWWMSSLAEKNYINSPRITDCLKILALEEILGVDKPEHVHVYTNDKELLNSIHALCTRLRISCLGTRVRGHKKCHVRWWSVIPFRPKPLVAAWWLMQHIRSNWRLRQKEKPDWFADSDSVTFFSNFFNLDQDKCSRGEFYTTYWGVLPETLKQHGLKINWMHRFIFSSSVKDCHTGNAWIGSFNQDSVRQGKHALFDGYLSLSVILRTCFNFFRLLLKSFTFGNVSRAFQLKGSDVYLWPLLKQEWLASTRGATAMRNLLFIELVDIALEELPKQNLGLYLQENLFWERALIHAWRRHVHGKLVGFCHATVRYWDLRYFEDTQTTTSKKMCSLELPDYVALNGPVEMQNYIDAGYPAKGIVEVESVRYLYLVDYLAIMAQKKNEGRLAGNPSCEIRVIMLGDIRFDVTDEMIRCIEKSLPQKKQTSFTLKAHPACPMNLEDYSVLKPLETTLHLSDCLPQFSLAIAAGATSAALDAYLAGLRVIIFLSCGDLNLNPLRGVAGVTFVSTPSEMASALAAHDSYDKQSPNQDFFWLDPNLPRWRKLLADSGYPQILKKSEHQIR